MKEHEEVPCECEQYRFPVTRENMEAHLVGVSKLSKVTLGTKGANVSVEFHTQ